MKVIRNGGGIIILRRTLRAPGKVIQCSPPVRLLRCALNDGIAALGATFFHFAQTITSGLQQERLLILMLLFRKLYGFLMVAMGAGEGLNACLGAGGFHKGSFYHVVSVAIFGY